MADTYRFLSMPLAPATFRFAGPNPESRRIAGELVKLHKAGAIKNSRTLPSTRTWSKASAPALENETSKRGARENMSTNPIIRYRHPIYGEQLRPQLNSPKASAQFAESFSSSGKRTAATNEQGPTPATRKASRIEFPPIGRKPETSRKRSAVSSVKLETAIVSTPYALMRNLHPSQARRRSPRANTQQETMNERVMSSQNPAALQRKGSLLLRVIHNYVNCVNRREPAQKNLEFRTLYRSRQAFVARTRETVLNTLRTIDGLRWTSVEIFP